MTQILTYTGKSVSPLSLLLANVCIEDIAHALALCNRFCGHTREPLSVAQHSVFVSRLCPPAHALQGLLHDASEAYLNDIAKPVKESSAFKEYRAVENLVQAGIYQKYGCQTWMSPEVKEADELMLRFEGPQAFGLETWRRWIADKDCTLLSNEEQVRVGKWSFWSWQQAERSFLDRARWLGVTE